MEFQENRSKTSIALAVFIIIQIVFIIFIVLSFLSVNQDDKIDNRSEQPKASIENLNSEEANLPDNFIDDIQHSVTEAIELNADNFDPSNLNISVRDGSLKVVDFSQYSFKALSAIIDIPSLEQSYQVFYKYPSTGDSNEIVSTNNNPRAVLCLDDKSEIIYSNFSCQDSFPSNVRLRIVADYLKFSDFNTFSASINEEEFNRINISPAATNFTEQEKTSAIAQTKAFIESLGISPDLFEFHIITQEDLNYRINP